MATPKAKYTLVSSRRALQQALKRCGPTAALDFETTSLQPSEGRVRLVSLCNKKAHYLVDFDQIKGGFRAVAHLFKGTEWIVFYAGFEQRWFNDAGSPEVHCVDVGNLRRAIMGGGHFKLMQIALWDLGITMNKEEQASNWAAPKLTQSQLDYAYDDAEVTWALWRYWYEQADAGHLDGMNMLNDMVPATIEMEEAGMKLSPRMHLKLCQSWEKTQADLIKTIRSLVGEADVKNIQSDRQWSDYFAALMPDTWIAHWPKTEKTGQLEMKSATLRRLAAKAGKGPLAETFDALADYKTITKYLSSFGRTLITKAKMSEDGRVHASYNIGAAKTCRFSSSGPNLQQIPRDKELLGVATSVRKSFIAPRGFRLVSLDYSGIELRTLALLSGDDQLLYDVIHGDVHAEVAAVVAGRPIDKRKPKDKALRSDAKKISFGIIYGAGANGIAVSMRTSLGRAQDYIDFWAERYPKAYNYRYKIMEEVEKTRFCRMVDGGTVYMGKRADLPKCANYPVQRAALSVMANAIRRHKNTLDDVRAGGWQKDTRILSTIHDALIDEARTKDAKDCLNHMEQDMICGFLDVFPGASTDNLVEGGIGPNWGKLD